MLFYIFFLNYYQRMESTIYICYVIIIMFQVDYIDCIDLSNVSVQVSNFSKAYYKLDCQMLLICVNYP